ncbi:MAG: betaine/proline/choline family ABC transporter ATP-binding protein [Chloroflexota bacterium]
MPAIAFDHLTKEFDGAASPKAAVHDITFAVEEGNFVVLLGPSGCGKTTLMRMVNRLIEPTSGKIFIDGTEVHQIEPTDLRRRIGYVIQQVGLFPHMTVEDNIAVVPRLLGWQKQRISARTDELLDLVALPPAEYRKRYPRQLSGGQQQRVGIARAMAADPQVMLMDEPFGAIDAITRADLQDELLAIQRKVGKTVIFVTHDVEEALRLADRIAVMRAGEVVQYDSPLGILDRPADRFVETLLDTGDVFRHLSLVPVSELMEIGDGARHENGLTIPQDRDARAALSTLIGRGAEEVTVVDADNRPVGHLTLARVLSEGARNRGQHGAADG